MPAQSDHSSAWMLLYKSAAVVVWIVSFYFALVICERKETELQNRVEELSKQIDKQAKRTHRKVLAYFNNVARVVNGGFDRLLGAKLVSVQMIGVSTSLSLSGMFLGAGFLFGVFYHRLRELPSFPKTLPSNLVPSLSFLAVFCLVVGIVLLFFALLPSVWSHPLTLGVSALPVVLIVAGTLRLWLRGTPIGDPALLVGALAIAVMCDVGLLVLIRQSIRWIAATVSPLMICAAIVAQLALAVSVVWMPIDISADLKIAFHWKMFPQFLGMISILNIFTGLAALVLVLALLGLLVHRLFWPVLSAFLQRLDQHNVMRNHRFWAAVCLACTCILVPSALGKFFAASVVGMVLAFFDPAFQKKQQRSRRR